MLVPADAITRPLASVTGSGRSTSIGPIGSSSSVNLASSTTSTASMPSPSVTSTSFSRDVAPSSRKVSSSGERSPAMPPAASLLTGIVTMLPPVPPGEPTSTASDANSPSSSTAASAAVGVDGKTRCGTVVMVLVPSVEL